MSSYTTEVRYICERAIGLNQSVGNSSIRNVIAQAAPKIFDFEYPIFDPSYKSVLEQKILRHFYTREIAFETVGLWKLKLETKMTEIMPYYNQLYNSTLYEYNPYYDVDLTKTYNRQEDGTEKAESNQNVNGVQNSDLNQVETTKQSSNSSSTEDTNNNLTRNENKTETNKQDKDFNTNNWENKTITGGDTETSSSDNVKTENSKSTKLLTRNLTDKTVETETDKTDKTIDTTTGTTSDGTTTNNITLQDSGTDETSGTKTVSGNSTTTSNQTESRDLSTHEERETDVLGKVLDTPQDNLVLFEQSQYLTGASSNKTNVTGDTDNTGTVETTGDVSQKETTDTKESNTTTYGKKQTNTGTVKITQNQNGTGSEVTNGTVTKNLTSDKTGGGTETTDNTVDGTINENLSSTKKIDRNTKESTNTVKSENENITGNISGNLTVSEGELGKTTSNQQTDNSGTVETVGGNKVTHENTAINTSNTAISNLEQYTEKVFGRNGGRSFAATLNEFRETFLNIDMMIIRDLGDLFFTLW